MSQSKLFILFNSSNNNNKFYEATLDVNSEDISVRYGRVGTSGQRAYYSGGLKKFTSLISSKIKKGYKEVQLDPQAGDRTTILCESSPSVLDIALRQISCADEVSRALVKSIADANIHNITSTTNITFDNANGLFTTPLGVVCKEAVLEASSLLDEIEKHLTSSDGLIDETAMRGWNDSYYALIPNRIANTRDTRLLLYSQSKIDVQRSICRALLETLELIDDLEQRKTDIGKEARDKIFNVRIENVVDSDLLAKIIKYFDDSKNHHHGRLIMGSNIHRLYKIVLQSQQAPFESAKEELGNVHQLWHGTRVANLLSILGKGLLLPQSSPGVKVGAMFGDGLYFANQSSKSANYCDGMYWTAGSHSDNNKIYMFMASVAVGKAFVPKRPIGGGNPPKGYDSIWAKAGRSSVLNDEIVVFRGDQVRLDYLLEIDI